MRESISCYAYKHANNGAHALVTLGVQRGTSPLENIHGEQRDERPYSRHGSEGSYTDETPYYSHGTQRNTGENPYYLHGSMRVLSAASSQRPDPELSSSGSEKKTVLSSEPDRLGLSCGNDGKDNLKGVTDHVLEGSQNVQKKTGGLKKKKEQSFSESITPMMDGSPANLPPGPT